MSEHGPWARAEYAVGRLWLACTCGWNAMGDAIGTYDEHAELHSLDDAWRKAEAALPEGWSIGLLMNERQVTGRDWVVMAGDDADDPTTAEASGPTPTAALLALAERLVQK